MSIQTIQTYENEENNLPLEVIINHNHNNAPHAQSQNITKRIYDMISTWFSNTFLLNYAQEKCLQAIEEKNWDAAGWWLQIIAFID